MHLLSFTLALPIKRGVGIKGQHIYVTRRVHGGHYEGGDVLASVDHGFEDFGSERLL